MIVFHASTVKINDFYIPYGGLHFGGMHSALECALRKLYQGKEAGYDIDTIHIHRCELTGSKYYESDDLGSDVGWRKLYNNLTKNNVDFQIVKYINKYEPDVLPSYCVFDTSMVKILDHSTMHIDRVEDILNGVFSDEYRYNY
ncbi:hypothetical protein GAP32_055 [Cronobacter phage vB_CsaM_GAP32]|uniref:Uncharacterized protein n=1 Tax=Cronobacter phage vB_CsaM_GAP32 TaxID=1141136 RepID=K4F6F4_9CAUD|nr:hypothetical protein GAP32_055 [Cronobacter phage vB_CsaM_GAP32]AFC21503.1 hypothetical protein GAP32_055 [Cronobacter phage vB_CsaM_GAP32]